MILGGMEINILHLNIYIFTFKTYLFYCALEEKVEYHSHDPESSVHEGLSKAKRD